MPLVLTEEQQILQQTAQEFIAANAQDMTAAELDF